MPNYRYKAVDKSGKSIKGEYTAKTQEDVQRMLRDKGYFPTGVDVIKATNKDIKLLEYLSFVSLKDIAIFCRQFYTMLNAGVTILKCLDILRVQTEKKKLREIIGDIYEEVQKGLTFSESLRKFDNVFPELLINMVEAGEASGNLDVIMDRMATHYEKENKIKNKVRGAMIYPIILGIVSILVVAFLLTFVMPTFVGMFEGSGVELPLPTRILLSISDFLRNFWYLVIAIITFIIYFFKKYAQSENGKFLFDNIKFKIPIVNSTTQKVVTSRFTRTLSTLLSSGIPLMQALDIVSRVVDNKVVQKGILNAKDDVKKGISLSEPIKRIGVFPPMVDSMISIGEESGALDEILEKTANFYDEEVEVALHKMTTMLEPIMIVLMAVIIGAIVIAMVLPMFDMINTVTM